LLLILSRESIRAELGPESFESLDRFTLRVEDLTDLANMEVALAGADSDDLPFLGKGRELENLPFVGRRSKCPLADRGCSSCERASGPWSVDIASAKNDGDFTPSRAFAIGRETCQRRRTSSFRQVVRVLVKGADGRCNFVIRDLDDRAGTGVDHCNPLLVRHPNRDPVGEGGGRVDRHRPGRYAFERLETTPTMSVRRPRRSRVPINPQIPEPSPIGA